MWIAYRNRRAALFSVQVPFPEFADAIAFCEIIYYFYTLSRETRCLFRFTVSPVECRTRYLLNVNRGNEQSMVGHEGHGEQRASLQEDKRYKLKQKKIRARTLNKTVDIL